MMFPFNMAVFGGVPHFQTPESPCFCWLYQSKWRGIILLKVLRLYGVPWFSRWIVFFMNIHPFMICSIYSTCIYSQMVFEREFLIRGVTGQNLANHKNWAWRHELMAKKNAFVCRMWEPPSTRVKWVHLGMVIVAPVLPLLTGWFWPFSWCSAGYPRHISRCPNMAWAENMKCWKKFSKIGFDATQLLKISYKFHQVGRLWKTAVQAVEIW